MKKYRLKYQPPFTVSAYHCPICGHIFHTAKFGLSICNKCERRALAVIDKHKSKKPPRASGKRNNWITKTQ